MERVTRERRTLRRMFSISCGALLLAACSSATQTVTPTPSVSVYRSAESMEPTAMRFASNMSRGAIGRLCAATNRDGEKRAMAAWVYDFKGGRDPALGTAVFDDAMDRC